MARRRVLLLDLTALDTAIAETYDAMHDMPHDDLQPGTQRKTVDQPVGADALLAGSGEVRWSAFARTCESDRLAGVTDVFLRSWDPPSSTGATPACCRNIVAADSAGGRRQP